MTGGGDDTSIGLWVMGYNIKYMDDRRLGVGYGEAQCPENFVGEPYRKVVHSTCVLLLQSTHCILVVSLCLAISWPSLPEFA